MFCAAQALLVSTTLATNASTATFTRRPISGDPSRHARARATVRRRGSAGSSAQPSWRGMDVDELFDAWERAWSGRDTRAFESVCARDLHYEDPFTPEPLIGVRALKRHAKQLWRA